MNWLTQYDAMPGMETAVDVQAGAFPSDDWFYESVGAWSFSDAGVPVNPQTALSHGPVWQAVNILSGDVGQLPFHKMRRSGRNTEKDRSHWTEYLLTDSPNEYQTPGQWKETLMAWALLHGNAICAIVGRGSQDSQLVPLHPNFVSPLQDDDGAWTIHYRDATRSVDMIIPYRDVFHIRGLATDGFWGLSAVGVAKNVIGHGLALQKHGDSVFKNAARPSGYLRKPEGVMSPEARANLRREWEDLHSGSHNAGRVAVLWEGLEFHQLSMSNEDAQWLEGRKLDREFIASLFNLPAFKLNSLENSAVRANLEEQNRDYFNTSLSRWTNKFAEEARRKLLTDRERRSGRHFYRWFPEAFLRGDTKTRFESYSLAITNQWMSPNEVREKEDMNPYEGGDEFLNPAINPAADQPAPEQSDSDDLQEAAANAVKEVVLCLLRVESNRCKAAAKKAANFVAWIDDYYGEQYEEVAAEMLTPHVALAAMCGHQDNWRAAIRSHAAASKREWLALLDMVTNSELADVVGRRSDTVLLKAETLTQRILGHE